MTKQEINNKLMNSVFTIRFHRDEKSRNILEYKKAGDAWKPLYEISGPAVFIAPDGWQDNLPKFKEVYEKCQDISGSGNDFLSTLAFGNMLSNMSKVTEIKDFIRKAGKSDVIGVMTVDNYREADSLQKLTVGMIG